MVKPAIAGPCGGGTWESCDIVELVAAYALSASEPGAVARVWLVGGRPAAEGGDPLLGAVLQRRADELSVYLSESCSVCRKAPAEFWVGLLGPSRSRVCGVCFFEMAEKAADGHPGSGEAGTGRSAA